jgi:hypothetical protein
VVKAPEELLAASAEGFTGLPAAGGYVLAVEVEGLEELNGLLFQNARLGIDHLPPL